MLLAESIRPRSLASFVGQRHLVSENGLITSYMRLGRLPSMVLSGPPGIGKTTLARIVASEVGYVFMELSATESGVAEMRELAEGVVHENRKRKDKLKVVLFIDEIHRFSTKQQDFLLAYVEAGTFVFIGATTQPQRLRRALLSRCQLFTLQPLGDADLQLVVEHAVQASGRLLSPKAVSDIVRNARGDVRAAINAVEANRVDDAEPDEYLLQLLEYFMDVRHQEHAVSVLALLVDRMDAKDILKRLILYVCKRDIKNELPAVVAARKAPSLESVVTRLCSLEKTKPVYAEILRQAKPQKRKVDPPEIVYGDHELA